MVEVTQYMQFECFSHSSLQPALAQYDYLVFNTLKEAQQLQISSDDEVKEVV